MVRKTARTIVATILLAVMLVPAINVQIAYAVVSDEASATTGATPKIYRNTETKQEREKATTSGAKTLQLTAMQELRNKFKEQMAVIKDQAKQKLVQKIDERLAEINKEKTERYTKALDTMQTFLDKASQSTKAANLTNIQNAQKAIDTAREAVETQAEKTYTMSIESEETLRVNAGTVISQFKKDISAVYKLIVSAKVAVQKVYINNQQTIKKGASESAQM